MEGHEESERVRLDPDDMRKIFFVWHMGGSDDMNGSGGKQEGWELQVPKS